MSSMSHITDVAARPMLANFGYIGFYQATVYSMLQLITTVIADQLIVDVTNKSFTFFRSYFYLVDGKVMNID